ncbi:MAG: hypothetical protein OES57_10705 [Acidimicrobiia bacterium]|nr:hypothetical protein [Acidimicrobiia bacterium]
MPTPTVTIRRVRRTVRLARRVPPSLRRPRRALRVALIGAGLWFAVLFAALGFSGGQPAPASVVFGAAACIGVTSVVLVGAGRFEPAIWSIAAMLVIGQAAAVSLAW